MSSRLADEREQRRGLIVGLTLAEVLLLLLFLLLLVLTSQVETWRDKYEKTVEQLKPLQRALMAGGAVDIDSVEQLVARFQALQNSEHEIDNLKTENADLAKQLELVKSLGLVSSEKLNNVAEALKQAAEIQPDDPPALLKRALDVIDRLGPSTKPDQVKPLAEMLTSTDSELKIAALEADKDTLRRQRDNLMRGPGNGLTYPSCWTTSAGQTEYVFDVTLADQGVQIRDASPARANDKAWSLIGTFPRETMINENLFISATKKLFEWSKGQNCRFYTIVRDGTGSSKDRYKHLQQMVEGNFYPLYLSPQRKRASGVIAIPSISPGEDTTSSTNAGLSPVH